MEHNAFCGNYESVIFITLFSNGTLIDSSVELFYSENLMVFQSIDFTPYLKALWMRVYV